MEELHYDTNIGLAKKTIKPSIAKIDDPPTAKEEQHPNQQQITPSNFIIQSKKIQRKRTPFPEALLLSANYSCGCSLKSLSIQQNNDVSFQVTKTKRFPITIFQINQITEKSRSFVLLSNFLGNTYNLFEDQQNVLTISFAAGFCNHFGSRQFSMYMLTSGSTHAQLKRDKKDQDLQEIFALPENEGKITKFTTLQPKRNLESGNLQLNFARKHILPAVQNAILVDTIGQQTMEIVKLGVNQFEVSFKYGLPKHYAVALGIASLDFKWALQ